MLMGAGAPLYMGFIPYSSTEWVTPHRGDEHQEADNFYFNIY
jgi:hypothetical protein